MKNLESNTSNRHKTCSRRGICSVGLNKKGCTHHNKSRLSDARKSLNRTSLTAKVSTSAVDKIKDM